MEREEEKKGRERGREREKGERAEQEEGVGEKSAMFN